MQTEIGFFEMEIDFLKTEIESRQTENQSWETENIIWQKRYAAVQKRKRNTEKVRKDGARKRIGWVIPLKNWEMEGYFFWKRQKKWAPIKELICYGKLFIKNIMVYVVAVLLLRNQYLIRFTKKNITGTITSVRTVA